MRRRHERGSGLYRRLGLSVLDLTPALRRADASLLDGAYFTYDPHWTALGHRVAAAEVARSLRERGWVPACAASR